MFLLAGGQAEAAAPVIFDIPSPVISDEHDITVANEFVYVDAIDLSRWVSDPDGGPNPVVWSYDIVGIPRYRINGVGVLGAGDPVDPDTVAISTQVLGDEYDDDSDSDDDDADAPDADGDDDSDAEVDDDPEDKSE